MKIHRLIFPVILLLAALTPLVSAEPSAGALFDQANALLAKGKAQEALDKYLEIASDHGTNKALVDNIAVAAERAEQPGVLEWAKATRQLRLAEWAVILCAAGAVFWAAAIALGVWKRWGLWRYVLTSICALGITVE